MRQSFKLLSASSLLLMMLWSTGCATTTINSGLQAGDLPPVGDFTAANGLQFNIQPLSLATLPVPQVTRPNKDIYQLIASSKKTEYRISQGDILSINLVGYPDMTPTTASNSSNPYASGYPVDQQGFVQFPLVGRVKASGLSVPQFTASLQSKLQRYLKYSDPQVKIINYRGNKFFIDGDVKQPGEFAIDDAPVSLYSAISRAGGATETGDSNSIVLNRNGRNYNIGLQMLRQIGSSGNQLYIQDGDSIHVNSQSRNTVYVLGEFGQIEPVPILEQGLSLAQVLGSSKGLNSATANAAKVYVVRDNPSYQHTNIYYVDMQTITNLALANRFEMQPNDILYVDPTGLTRWNRVISSILPSTSAIRSIATL
ncbi:MULTISPECIES: polysaccharide biosynthesis/export family protein [unclassified Psychrobacter]|uniref:polysaccharide biosynthesis/export family protein n=1 Tax=unclassified Psychrobacter TaxID=196806 RepID=UPI0025B2DA7C|nr:MULTISPECIES: polysaccharide biosynthesis/export family protein [unclassified Psychrobacter]MDN3453870.1 polysaccharide biosynthesis/export family protein [Psychrobacter sp. APC 3350]MDN3502062.1 polysaccharide biosynthesis/export family protein [Psychrobacter sp. 5A.1]